MVEAILALASGEQTIDGGGDRRFRARDGVPDDPAHVGVKVRALPIALTRV